MIVNRISRVMGEQRVTMAELARRTGLAYSTVHDLYHGRARRIELDTLDRLCRALNAEPNDLFQFIRGTPVSE